MAYFNLSSYLNLSKLIHDVSLIILLTICTTRPLLLLMSSHAAHANVYQTSPLSRYLAVHYLTPQRVLSHNTFLFCWIFPHLHNPSWSTHSESYPLVYPSCTDPYSTVDSNLFNIWQFILLSISLHIPAPCCTFPDSLDI